MDKNSPNLEDVLKSLKNFEIQKVIRGLKGLNFPEEIDSLIKSEIDKSCSKSTPFDVEEWLALLWRRVDLLHKECNRYLAMVGGGSGVISIATLFWTLIGLWSTKTISLTPMIFLILIFVVFFWIMLPGIFLLAENVDISLIILGVISFCLIIIGVNVHSLFLTIFALILTISFILKLKSIAYKRKLLQEYASTKIYGFLTFPAFKMSFVFYFVILATLVGIFQSIYGFDNIGIGSYKVSLVISIIIVLSVHAFGWLTQYTRLKAEENFNIKLIMDVMSGVITEPKEICAIFTSNQSLIEKGFPLAYSYIKNEVKKKLSMN